MKANQEYLQLHLQILRPTQLLKDQQELFPISQQDRQHKDQQAKHQINKDSQTLHSKLMLIASAMTKMYA